ncbi:oxidoreductase [Serinibacter arcticus]|uniref:Oxidoreductase n=1 Tax=Serinibacter arcticus TaxID=1655435 RepID=A0A2U1ZSE8_9MICO|nr:NADH:flavin oxidoreductase/NADH oxidase [Serinibacter arcticus]PWD49908.1 oxidoreductase [Serinibacter arcticus]
MPTLFDPLQLRGLEIPNRIWMSPMCTYSAEPDPARAGRPTDFHLAHYGARAAGGVGLVMVEATGVTADGRISPYDLGLWEDGQVADFARLARVIADGGAVPGVQLAHAGRKASVDRPWRGGGPVDEADHGWPSVGASPDAFPGYPVPRELTVEDIRDVVASFAASATRALEAGFEVVEIHAAHGYLLHSFLSPASNGREDHYGGSLENRARIVLEVVDAVRAVWPQDRPILMRVSTTDWISEDPSHEREGWTVADTVQLARWAGERGVDLIDGSSGGLLPAPIPSRRDYQTALTARVRAEAGVAVAAVGRIDDAAWAAELVASEQAEAVFVGRALLRDPSWANDAATELDRARRYLVQYDYAL